MTRRNVSRWIGSAIDESPRNNQRSLRVSLPRPLSCSQALLAPGGTTLSEVIEVPLEQRLLEPSDIDESRLIDADRDITIRSREGKSLKTKSIALRNMSGYFIGAFRSQMSEITKREFKIDFSFPVLRALVGFFETGRVIVCPKTIQQIFVALHYFQVTSLIEPCKYYLEDNLPETAAMCFRLASLYEGMEDLASQAAICCAENLLSLRSSILRFPGHYLAAVISQDALDVSSEDELVKLIIAWSERRVRSEGEILHVLENVRYPHLSPEGFMALRDAFEVQVSKVEFAQLCLNNRFSELPEEQLTRRKHYMDHMHIVWSEMAREVRPTARRETKLKMTCLRCSPRYVHSHELLEHIPEMRNGNLKFQFVSVMNSLYFVTHSAELRDIVIYKQQKNGRWLLHSKIQRVSKIEEFGVCAFQAKIILTMFAGYTEFIRCVEIDTRDSNVYRVIDLRHPPHTSLSAPQMSFHNDWLIFLRHDRIHLSDPWKEDFRELPARNPHSRRGIEALSKFRSFVRCDKYIYVYKDTSAPSSSFRRVGGLFDRVLKVNVDNQRVEKSIEMRKPLYAEFNNRSRKEKRIGHDRVRKIFVSGSKLLVALQELENDLCRFVQLSEDHESFSILADIRCVDSQKTYTRQLEQIVPTHIHDCGYRTLLGDYCSSLSTDHATLERLSFYL